VVTLFRKPLKNIPLNHKHKKSFIIIVFVFIVGSCAVTIGDKEAGRRGDADAKKPMTYDYDSNKNLE
jgi:hypothetical protein